jgi:bacterioferritin-associated ferredoxin
MGVSDREIRGVIRNGASTTREVAQACEASRGCGGCRPAILEILAKELEASAPALPRAVSLSPALSAG